MKTRAWWLYLLVMAPIVGLYQFGPGIFNEGPVFNGFGLSAVVAIVVGVRMHRPSDARPWYLFAVGLTLFVTGDVLAYNFDTFFGRQPQFPGAPDVFYLAVFPVLVAGLLLLVRRRNAG